MRVHAVCVILVLASVAAANPPVLPKGDEAPRATDLLRAEKMADEAARRLRLPAPKKRSAWVRGGEGWTRAEPPPEPPVTIKVVPPRARVAKTR